MSWWQKERDHFTGDIHALGNGKMLAYEQGPEILQLFGPPYSSPSFMQLLFNSRELDVNSKRIPQTAIWEHELIVGENTTGKMTDFITAEIPCMIRKIETEKEICLNLSINDDFKVIENDQRFQEPMTKGLLVEADPGIYIYNKYPTTTKTSYQILASGQIELNRQEDNSYVITCKPGESYLYFVGGPDYPACMNNVQTILNSNYKSLKSATQIYWQRFSAKRHDYSQILPADLENRDKLLQIIDDVSVLIKAQQAQDGAVMAGYNYHLGYVRDQYGVARCLLKLGYYTEARSILDFYWNIWQQYGRIYNAQTSGAVTIFHKHENDDVEITGYLIIQAFDYYYETGDKTYLNKIFPMLIWAWRVQKQHLAGDMLPFNGDETYVAGGLLPRYTLNDGSAAATLLFITAGDRLLDWIDKNNLWSNKELADNRKLLQEVKNNYRDNFLEGNELLTNNPARKDYTELPQYRHGVCEGCQPMAFDWTEKSASDRYLCSECIGKVELEKIVSDKFYLQAVTLLPIFIGSDFFNRDEITMMTERLINHYHKTHKLSSSNKGNKSVGYEYGFLLNTLIKLNHPLAETLYQHTLSITDSTGAWVEYYIDDEPTGTRCRPWESGINLEAIINYIEQK